MTIQVTKVSMLKAFIYDEHGEDMIEYGLLASFISVSAIAILRTIGMPLIAMFQEVLVALT